MSHEARVERRPTLPSLLPRSLRGLLAVFLVLAAFMLANTAYLLINRLADALGWGFFAVGETSLPKLFQSMVLTHTGVGLLLAVLMLTFFSAHLPKVWKRRHRASVLSGILVVLVGLALVVTGLFILTAAASRDNRWAWWAHVICAALSHVGRAEGDGGDPSPPLPSATCRPGSLRAGIRRLHRTKSRARSGATVS